MGRIRFEHCPACGSVHTENIFHIEDGELPKVHVRCAECGAFVARYVIQRYTSDKSNERLKTKNRRYVEPFNESVKAEHQHILELLKNQGEEYMLIEQLIDETDIGN